MNRDEGMILIIRVLRCDVLCEISVVVVDDSHPSFQMHCQIEEAFGRESTNIDYIDAVLNWSPLVFLEVGSLDDELIRGAFNQNNRLGKHEAQGVVSREFLEVGLCVSRQVCCSGDLFST